MDPLSITASALAVGGFVATIGKGIKTLRTLSDAPEEFCTLLEELAMLQVVTHNFEILSANLPDTHPDIFRQRLRRTVEKLESLVERFEKSSRGIDQQGRLKIPPLRWNREQKNIERLREQARQTRDYLSAYLTTLGISQRYLMSSTTVFSHFVVRLVIDLINA